jgi:hypothetical protein
MRNIFILYMAPGNYEQMVHYQDTIKNKVVQERIFRFINFNLQSTLRNIFGNKAIAVWGSRDSSANRSHYEKMQQGDDVLIVEGNTIKLLGKIASKTINSDLSRELWHNLQGDADNVWSLIYFIANPLEIELPFNEVIKLFHYQENYKLRGFTSISNIRLEEFYNRYDDLYSILQRIKQGKTYKTYEQQAETGILQVREEAGIEIQPEDVEEILKNGELSEHVKVQWKLILLGLKTGSRVWVPRNDQQKIQTEYKFNEFELSFSAGIDMPAKYVENIDVVWKEEFRIDAAFEIEHSTAIYSGLLRFADLKIIAPNINYPLFIVAPIAKRNRVFEQMRRPVFKKLGLDKEVRYISYETIDGIDKFFENSSSGLNVDLLVGKSESAH